MFEDSMIESGGKKKATKRWLTFPLSLLLHSLLIGAFIVVPLMNADSNLPDVKVINVFLSSPPPPPPTPPTSCKEENN